MKEKGTDVMMIVKGVGGDDPFFFAMGGCMGVSFLVSALKD